MANIEFGIVNDYDAASCTAQLTSFDGLSTYNNAGIMMSTYDPTNGVYSSTPPSIGAPCLYSLINGEAIILGQYAPPNLGSAPDTVSSLYNTVNRSTDDMGDTSANLPGNWQIKGHSGGEVSLRDMVFSIKMNPLFYSTWNTLNGIWDNMCRIFKLSSAGVSISSGADVSGSADTSIQVRTSVSQEDGTPAVDLQIGASAGVILLKINGSNFCHVDSNRHIVLSATDIDIVASDIHVTAGNMIVSGSKLDCSGVGKVKLPR